MKNKISFIFIVLFIFVPFSYILSFFIWKSVINKGGLMLIATECLSIIGMYYLITSVIFFVIYIKKINIKDF